MTTKLLALNSGRNIPYIGYGTGTAWIKNNSNDNSEGVSKAIKAGFRHIDTAEHYENESSTGDGIIASGIPRDQIFITTKQKRLNDPRALLQKQLEELKTDYVDLLLIHDPTMGDIKKTWKLFEEFYAEGKAKSIGISNFKVEQIKEILEVAKVIPAVNQIELHPYVYREAKSIVDFCHDKGIKIAAFAPQAPVNYVTDGPVTPVLEKIAKRLSNDHSKPVTIGQVSLKWAETKGDIIMVTTTKEDRLKEYLNLVTIPDLTEDEVNEITDAGKDTFFRKYMRHCFD